MVYPSTYSTSQECGEASGIATVDANSYPTQTMIDNYRLQAKTAIGQVIGQDIRADPNLVIKAIEIAAVSRKIEAINNRQTYTIELFPFEITRLKDEFPNATFDGDFVYSPGITSAGSGGYPR
jgi:hypothetical protein